MQSSFRIGSLFDIDIGIHYSWLIVFALVTWSLAVGFFPQQFPGWSTEMYWTIGAISSLLLFASVLIHELSHSLVARREGMPVESITLFIFGGVSNIGKEAEGPQQEFLMAFVGPLSSLVLAVVFGAGWFLAPGINPQTQAILLYLALVNLLLALFNLIPAFPLDGGRVLRAILWWTSHSMFDATRIASMVGQGFAYLFIFGGLFWAFTGNIISGLWLMVIGWFLSNAADSSYRQVVQQQVLKGVHVQDMMTKEVQTVGPHVTLHELVENYILPHSIRALPVVADSRLLGIVTLSDVRHVPRERWDQTTVSQVMTPLDRLHVLRPDDDLGVALSSLGEQDLNQLPVVREGRVVGLVTRGHLIRYMQLKQELGGGP
ncbi:MAG: site-2 protease family protein [Chloroflexi bacterium]|nr:site-2 protease family protein [Chloroflexota bacterium]